MSSALYRAALSWWLEMRQNGKFNCWEEKWKDDLTWWIEEQDKKRKKKKTLDVQHD